MSTEFISEHSAPPMSTNLSEEQIVESNNTTIGMEEEKSAFFEEPKKDTRSDFEKLVATMQHITGKKDMSALEALIKFEQMIDNLNNRQNGKKNHPKSNKREILIHQEVSNESEAKAKAAEEALLKEIAEEAMVKEKKTSKKNNKKSTKK